MEKSFPFSKPNSILINCKYIASPVAIQWGFPGGSGSKEFGCKAGDLDLIPGSGRSPEEGIGHPLQYSNSVDSFSKQKILFTWHNNNILQNNLILV